MRTFIVDFENKIIVTFAGSKSQKELNKENLVFNGKKLKKYHVFVTSNEFLVSARIDTQAKAEIIASLITTKLPYKSIVEVIFDPQWRKLITDFFDLTSYGIYISTNYPLAQAEQIIDLINVGKEYFYKNAFIFYCSKNMIEEVKCCYESGKFYRNFLLLIQKEKKDAKSTEMRNLLAEMEKKQKTIYYVILKIGSNFIVKYKVFEHDIQKCLLENNLTENYFVVPANFIKGKTNKFMFNDQEKYLLNKGFNPSTHETEFEFALSFLALAEQNIIWAEIAQLNFMQVFSVLFDIIILTPKQSEELMKISQKYIPFAKAYMVCKIVKHYEKQGLKLDSKNWINSYYFN